MDEGAINRSYLEGLSSGELARLADRYGIDVPPDLERVFIIDELLEAARDEDEEIPPLAEADFMEPVLLPKQYNITYIDVMIRDPLWVFAFWEVKSHDRELYELSPDFGGYYLRAALLGDRRYAQGEDSFTVPVGAEDNAWYLGFPPAGGRFTVSLCVNRGSTWKVLAVSRPFRLPRLINPPERDDMAEPNPLIRLSGLEDLSVLRGKDRLSRIPKSSLSQAGGND